MAMVAPHFEEYALLLANAVAAHVPVRLFLDRRHLDRDFVGRVMPVAADLDLVDVHFGRPSTVATLLADLIAFRPSVLHIQEPSGWAKAIIATALVTALRPFCRIVLTVHDPEPHVGRDSAIVARFARLRAYVRGRSHIVLVHGEHCRSVYQRFVRPDQHVALTEHGVILTGEGSVPRLAAGPLRTISFGRMEAYKGLEVLCAAAEIMAREGTPFHLTVAGGGPELDRLESRLRALPQVETVKGFVPAAQLIDLIRASDCVVMPYLEATQSGVLAGAFANARFVVASDVGGIPDVVVDGENGLLVPPDDPAALAGALTRAASDPALRVRLSAGAARTAAARMGWNAIAERLLVEYRA